MNEWVKLLSRVRLFAIPWTVAYQAPLSMEFSRQKYWSGLPFPSPGDLPDPGIEPRSPALQADALPSEPPGKASLLPKSLQLSWPLGHTPPPTQGHPAYTWAVSGSCSACPVEGGKPKYNKKWKLMRLKGTWKEPTFWKRSGVKWWRLTF